MTWNVLGNLAQKVINPIFQIFIARLLLPEEYGIFAIALSTIAFFDVFRELGLTQSIIVQQDEKVIEKIRLQFTVQLFAGVVYYLILIAITPLLIQFFNIPDLKIILPLIGILFFINSFIDPILTYYMKTNNFKTIALRQGFGAITMGSVGLSLAYLGYGVYALVISMLLAQMVIAIYLNISFEHNLKIRWRKNDFFQLFVLGKQLIIQNFAGCLIGQGDSFILGKN